MQVYFRSVGIIDPCFKTVFSRSKNGFSHKPLSPFRYDGRALYLKIVLANPIQSVQLGDRKRVYRYMNINHHHNYIQSEKTSNTFFFLFIFYTGGITCWCYLQPSFEGEFGKSTFFLILTSNRHQIRVDDLHEKLVVTPEWNLIGDLRL